MDKTAALDLTVKGARLCKFLADEKCETLISTKFFDSLCLLSRCLYTMDNPSLSKADIASFRKNAAMEYSSANLYLEALYMAGFISTAQKDSMLKTIDSVKKQLNI